ncbi:hypothetical protein BE11_09495 [Sorangium cellulosum]|nr:hypothetical protein BE11_09495 [Sorangium cellulosum]
MLNGARTAARLQRGRRGARRAAHDARIDLVVLAGLLDLRERCRVVLCSLMQLHLYGDLVLDAERIPGEDDEVRALLARTAPVLDAAVLVDALEQAADEVLELRALVLLFDVLPRGLAHRLEEAFGFLNFGLGRVRVLPRLDGVDERLDGRPERVDRPHPRRVAHRGSQPRVDALVVGFNDADLPTGLPDGAHGNDVTVVGPGALLDSDGREVVPAGHPREDPAALLGEVGDDDHVALLEAVRFCIE